MRASRVRALVVEDSLTVRRRIVDALAADPAVDVVGEAADAGRAIELCRTLRPDVVTLDMVLAGSSGLAVTEHIMAHCPTPILIVSSSTNRGDLFRTYDALAAGAVDVLEKPLATDPGDGSWERRLVEAVKLVARIRVITHVRGRLGAPGAAAATSAASRVERATDGVRPGPAGARGASGPGSPRRAVLLGASTGGPGALAAILRELPADFPLPVLVVLHVGAPFGAALAEWLDGQSALRVSCARDGEPLPPARSVVLAPPERHLALEGRRLRLTDAPERHSCRPSVDVLFESAARELGPGAIAGLLTGMGRDGALGLRAVRDAGGATFAQDEASSVVFGMPREAVLLGAAERVVALPDVAAHLVALAGPRSVDA